MVNYLVIVFILFLIGVAIMRWAFRVNDIVDELIHIRKAIQPLSDALPWERRDDLKKSSDALPWERPTLDSVKDEIKKSSGVEKR